VLRDTRLNRNLQVKAWRLLIYIDTLPSESLWSIYAWDKERTLRHLVLRNSKLPRLVLLIIVCNALIWDVPTPVLVFGANSNNSMAFLLPSSVYKKVQVAIFFIQELNISGDGHRDSEDYMESTWRVTTVSKTKDTGDDIISPSSLQVRFTKDRF
jgi:hypothetical protein